MKLPGKRLLTKLERIHPLPRESWPLLSEPITLGSHSRNRVVVRDSYVSRYHAQIKLVNRVWQIEDLETTNGTQVNKEHIKGTRQLRNADRITLGKTWFRFSQEPVTGPPMSEHLGLLTAKEFEELIAELLTAEGFTNVMVTGRSGDGGIDIKARRDRPLIIGTYVVQCKRYDKRKRIAPLDVRAFHGAIAADPAAVGAFVTTSSFTKGAITFAESVGMAFVDGPQLVNLLVDHRLWPF